MKIECAYCQFRCEVPDGWKLATCISCSATAQAITWREYVWREYAKRAKHTPHVLPSDAEASK